MKTSLRMALLVLLLLGGLALSILYMSGRPIALLDPKGIIAIQEKELLITSSWLMLIVVIPVLLMLLIFSLRYRADRNHKHHQPNWAHSTSLEVIWWGVPTLIIIVLAILTWKSTHALNPFSPLESEKKPITIQVVALDWKWLFILPEEKIASVNYFRFPIETPLNFQITSDAPMNSFWIPELGGQIYAMPAMKTKLHLLAHKP